MNVLEFLGGTGFTVLWSGGKDSTAALLWVLDNIRHGDWDVLFVEMGGNTHPAVVEYVYSVAEKLGIGERLIHVRTEDFFENMERVGPPLLGGYRWCLRLKLEVFRRYGRPVQITGIKAYDSAIRKKLKEIEYMRRTKTILVHPLLHWSDRDVVNYIRRHGLELNPCYGLCGHSGGCMFCPYHSRTQILRTLQLPEWREKIIPVIYRWKEDPGIRGKVVRKWLRLSRQRRLCV